MFTHFPWSCFPSILAATCLLLPVLLSVEMVAWQKKLDGNNQPPRASDGEDDSEDEDDQTEPVIASTHLDSGVSIGLAFAYLCTSFLLPVILLLLALPLAVLTSLLYILGQARLWLTMDRRMESSPSVLLVSSVAD